MCQKVVLLIAQQGSVWSEAALTHIFAQEYATTLDLC